MKLKKVEGELLKAIKELRFANAEKIARVTKLPVSQVDGICSSLQQLGLLKLTAGDFMTTVEGSMVAATIKPKEPQGIETGKKFRSLEAASKEIFVGVEKFLKPEESQENDNFSTEELEQWRGRLSDSRVSELDAFVARCNNIKSEIDEYYKSQNLFKSDKHLQARNALRAEYEAIRLEKIVEYKCVVGKIEESLKEAQASGVTEGGERKSDG